MSSNRVLGVIALTAAATWTGCSSQSTLSAKSTSAAASSTTISAATSSVLNTTTPPATTPATEATTTIAGDDACPGADGIPAGADIGDTIFGDIDGDLADDTVTEYSLNGVPHVHSQLATGGQSDAEVPLGFANHVDISFNDFDYSLGAAIKPPVAVLAIGATGAGSAVFTFLTNTIHYCIQAWHIDSGEMFVGRISAQGPYEGLWCDNAAGHVFTNLTNVEPDGLLGWNVTTRLLHHNFTKIIIDPPQTFNTVGAESDIQHQYGDMSGCGHAPLFP